MPDFKGMLRPVAFATKKAAAVEADGVPAPLLRGAAGNRRLAALKEAGDILEVLPGPGESLHALMTGRYDLTDLLEVIYSRLGAVAHLRVATLSFNGHNLLLMKHWLEAGHVRRLSLLYSSFFADHNPEIVLQLAEALEGGKHRHKAARNHCKVVALEMADGRKLSLEGSANLRTNSNREQFALIDGPELHDWHAAWIDEQLSHGQAEKA